MPSLSSAMRAVLALIAALFVLATLPAGRAHAAPPIEAYGQLPAIEDVAISPSGVLLAMAGTFEGRRVVMVLDENRGLKRVIDIEDIKLRGIQFVGEDRILLTRTATLEERGVLTGKNEMAQTFVFSIGDNSPGKEVLSGNSTLHKTTFGSYGVRRTAGGWKAYYGALKYKRASNNGKTIFNAPLNLYEIDLADFKTRRVAADGPAATYQDWLIGEDGTLAVTFNLSVSSGKWSIENSSRQEIASGQTETGNAGLLGFGKGGTSLIYYSNPDDQAGEEYFEVPLSGGGQSEPYLPQWDANRWHSDPLTGEIIGYAGHAPDAGSTFFDTRAQGAADMIKAAFSGINFTIMGWSEGFGKVVVHTNSVRDSGTWFIVDMTTKSAEAIGYDRPQIGPDAVGAFSMVPYTAGDGLMMDGILTLPPGREAKNLPAIILPHGGPHAHDRAQFDWWPQALASRGYAVFQPNFRGSTGRGADFEAAGYGEWGGKMQSDISDGLMELVGQGIIDPTRVCIGGASYGGYAALSGVTLQQGLYRCAVSVAGVSDLDLLVGDRTHRGVSNKLFKRNILEELGPRNRWSDLSPRNQAARADAPVLLIHGEDDTVVEIEDSKKMEDALKAAGKDVTFVKLDGEDHWLSLPETRTAMLEAMIAFVEEHNPPD